MKIAIDARPINSKRKQGLFKYTQRLIYELAEIDRDNEYFLLFNSLKKMPPLMPGPERNNFVKEVIPLPDRKFPFKDFIFAKFCLPRVLNKYKCDIFHSTYSALNFPKNGVRYILTVHDLKSFRISDEYWKQDLKKYNIALKNADKIIAVSESTKKDILDFCPIPSEKIKVIYEGVDEIYRKIEDEDMLTSVSKKYGINKKFFFALGQVPRKNISRLIEAYSQFKYKNDFDLVIAGIGAGKPFCSTYFELVDRLSLNGNVRFIGYIENIKDLVYLYNISECFVFPSLYEGFGLPVLEAMACGAPVITSNVSALPEVGRDAALYVNPYNVQDIASAMGKIVEDQGFKNRLIDKGFLRAREFSWKKMAEETLETYIDCLR